MNRPLHISTQATEAARLLAPVWRVRSYRLGTAAKGMSVGLCAGNKPEIFGNSDTTLPGSPRNV